jgi:hypothetical protein
MEGKYVLFALRIMADFGLTIAAPAVILAMAGKALDVRFGTAPWLLIAGFALAAVCTGALIARKAKRYGEEYQKL